MKYIKYLFPLLAIGCLLAFAANEPEKMKILSKHPAAPPAAQSAPVPAPIRLAGAEDGIPYGLHIIGVEEKNVTLQWNNPEPMDGYFDDFEGHSDFVINSPGNIGWNYLDLDNAETYTWSAASFPNQGQKMAFIIMNPSKTAPSTATWPNIKPYSGNKMLVSFCAASRNNDYIISPELNFTKDFQLIFQAKSYSDQYGLERIRVGYSTKSNQPSDFIFLTKSPYEEVPAEWTLKQYTVPKEARYVTINCVSDDAFMLLIDDLFIGTNKIRPTTKSMEKQLTGFNLYRNGEKVNKTAIGQVTYTDEVPDFGDFRYTVTSVYSDNSESPHSTVLDVNVPDTRLLPFEDDFSSWTLNPSKWSVPTDEKGNQNNWKIDYFTYGLVDPAATFAYTRLNNYSQSLVTRELRTNDPDNTCLRFELRLLNYKNINGDTLSAELSCDDKNWKEIKSFCNDEGTFTWRTEQFDLKDLLKGQETFRIRFRAHGIEAFYLDYWYVDDVKVWTPQWASARLTVNQQGSPVTACPVTLTADHGAVIHSVTSSNGTIDLPRIEKGKYEVSILKNGSNTYKDIWEISNNENNQFTAILTRPVLHIDNTNLTVGLKAEEKASRQVILKNEGDGSMKWNLVPEYEPNSGDISGRWSIQQSFNTSGDLQTSVAFDGENFYTASWFHLGKYFKYDKGGNFLEEFSVPGMYYKLYDLAFDGNYFYGSDKSNKLFQLDLRNKRLVREIVISGQPDLEITHCSYDPRNDQFWVGGYNSLGRIDRDGGIKVVFRSISSETEVVSAGSAFDNITPGGPYLWFSNQVSMGNNSMDKTQIMQYNINTRKIVSTHSTSDIPGYKVGNDFTGPNFLNGLEATACLEDGTLTLIGVLQQSPSRIFAYKLCDANNWLTYSPKNGTLEPGAEQALTVNIDAKNGINGQNYATGLLFNSLPGTGSKKINISYTVTGMSETPRPVKLAAEVKGNADVKLSWETGNVNKQPAGYRVYRDGKQIAETGITKTEYTDKNLLHGKYTYTVTSVFENNKESVHSDKAVAPVKFGAPFYSPTQLISSVKQNRQVLLNWQSPGENAKTPSVLKWNNGINNDALGMGDGGYFWAGTLWEYEDLIDYRGMLLDKVDVFIKERCQALSLKIYKDDECIITQTIKSSGIRYGEFNTVILENPVKIEAGYSYKVTFLIMHDAGLKPIGLDGSAPVEGKGNIISMDGKEWYPATYVGVSKGNFNISIHLSPSGQSDELAPAGYNIYRNGTRINTTVVTERSYSDVAGQPGIHTYQVSSLYENGESALSYPTQAEIIDIGLPHAPSLLSTEVELNRTIRLRWNFPMATTSSFPVDLSHMPATCLDNHPEFVHMFRGKFPGEIGIASDGDYIYTSMFKANGTINKYTLNGEFIESFDVNSNLAGIRNLAFDGKDFYASDCNSFIYKIDMENKILSDTFSISEVARHLTYIPDLDENRGGFEVGDWETGIYVNMKGAKLGDGNVYKGAAGTAYFKGTLYAFEQGYENPYTICMYDFKTGKQTGRIDLKDYFEINPEQGASAGGMAVIGTKEGLHLLGLALQEPSGTRFIFLDLNGLKEVEGYNVYCNGGKLNDTPLKFRYYEEIRDIAGEYTYEIETVYVDGSTSGKSQRATIEIVESGNCEAPVQVKTRQSTYPYNVILSFVNPAATDTDVYESFESGTPGSPFESTGWHNVNNAWSVTEKDAYEGNKALTAGKDRTAWLILPVNDPGNSGVFSFVGRNSDDHNGNGSIRILYSSHSIQQEDFSLLDVSVTTEEWKQFNYRLPAGTTYVAIRQDAGTVPSYIDAISLNNKIIDNIYGYDIYRDGRKLNEKTVTGIGYTDHNLLPGDYSYQVKALYTTSCISDFSEKIAVSLNYSNNCQKPGPLSAEQTGEGIQLKWSAPSLGDAINLKWHSGTSYDAAGMPSGGSFFAGVQWSANELQPYSHLALSEVEAYINQTPDALFVLVYEGNNLVHQQYVPEVRQRSFNTIVLDNPIPVNAGKSLRVALYVEHNEITVPLGFDEGPSKNGKGNLYSSDGISWSTLSDNKIDGNWNITIGLRAYTLAALRTASLVINESEPIGPKAIFSDKALRIMPVERKATSLVNTFDGYNLYCNSEPVNKQPLQTITYCDQNLYTDKYLEYQVTAIYSGCGEVGSNTVRLTASQINEPAAGLKIRFHSTESLIIIDGVRPGMKISLSDINGKVLYSAVAGNDISYRINTASLAAGIYIIKADNVTQKIVITK